MGGLRPWARYGLLMAAHLLALGLGAAVLQALEGPPARRLQAQLRAELATFQAEYGACLPTGALEELLGTALAAQAHGISSLGNVSKAGNWDLPSALLFTASILTTTGKAARWPGRRAPPNSWGPWGYNPSPSSKVPDRAQALLGLTSQLGLSTPTHPNWCLNFSCQEGCGLPSPTPRHTWRPRRGAQTPWACSKAGNTPRDGLLGGGKWSGPGSTDEQH